MEKPILKRKLDVQKNSLTNGSQLSVATMPDVQG
jgi:hypothetical protein